MDPKQIELHEQCKYGLEKIIQERYKQVFHKGFTPEKDLIYNPGELRAYACYWMTEPDEPAMREILKQALQTEAQRAGRVWKEEAFGYEKYPYEERLAIAASLLAAEIDRHHLSSLAKNGGEPDLRHERPESGAVAE